MKILCKVKDFYDYVGYNASEDITFDRRNMTVIEPGVQDFYKDSEGGVINGLLYISNIFGVWIGHNFYVYRISNIQNRYERNIYNIEVLSKNFKYDIDLIAKRVVYDIPHKKPIELHAIEFPWDLRLNKHWFKSEQALNQKIDEEIIKGNIANWKLREYIFDSLNKDKIPILKNTFLARLDPSEVYYAIESWLLAQNNDVDQETDGITDVDKAVNHGFDKKESFRNCK